jgi:hypothetical protein
MINDSDVITNKMPWDDLFDTSKYGKTDVRIVTRTFHKSCPRCGTYLEY